MTTPGRAVLVRGDAACLPMPDASVDLVITSPPYFGLRDYEDEGEVYASQVGGEPTPGEYLNALWVATREMMRVLKPSGSIWVNLGDKYAGSGGHNNSGVSSTGRTAPKRYNQNNGGVPAKSLLCLPWRYALGCVDKLGLILRAEVIWWKPDGVPESVRDRVARKHEQLFHFTKRGQYFSAVDVIREPHASPHVISGRKHDGPAWGSRVKREGGSGGEGNPLGKLPGSVWSVPTVPLRIPDEARERLDLPEHYAAFPPELPRRIILGWSPQPGVVLDPFGGTGTTAMMAAALGRTGVSVDLSGDYCRLARWRTTESGGGEAAVARAAGKPRPPKPPPNMLRMEF